MTVPSLSGIDDLLDSNLRETLRSVLAISSETVASMNAETPLFGALPELDSMAVAALLTEVEDRFSILIDDDDIDGETFETYGNLLAFIQSKVAARE